MKESYRNTAEGKALWIKNNAGKPVYAFMRHGFRKSLTICVNNDILDKRTGTGAAAG